MLFWSDCVGESTSSRFATLAAQPHPLTTPTKPEHPEHPELASAASTSYPACYATAPQGTHQERAPAALAQKVDAPVPTNPVNLAQRVLYEFLVY